METTEILKKYCEHKYRNEIVIKTYDIQEVKQIIDFTKQLLIHSVVVPKGTLCKCGKEYSDNDKEHGMCHKCWKEIKD